MKENLQSCQMIMAAGKSKFKRVAMKQDMQEPAVFY